LYHARVPAPGGALGAGTAVAVTGGAIAAFLAVAIVAPPPYGLVVAQLAQVVTAIAMARGMAPRALPAIGIVRPRARFVVAAVLIGASAWYVNLALLAALHITGHETAQLEDLVTAPPLVAALAMLAIGPALGEEIVFRGVLARGLATAMPMPLAALASAAAFSLYHLSVVQALPTFVLGTLLAVVAIRGGSIVPTMIAHAINNAAAIVLSRDEARGAADWIDAHTAPAVAIGVAVCTVGVTLAAWSPA
jgi:membrane protease YdiL (CAAX protease family)